jgi:hypothetical protein
MAGWLTSVATHLALHSADPGPTGANETTAQRLAADWSAPVAGDLAVAEKAFIRGTPNGPVRYLGLWSAPTGGTFYGAFTLVGDQTFNANGDFVVSDFVISGGTS